MVALPAGGVAASSGLVRVPARRTEDTLMGLIGHVLQLMALGLIAVLIGCGDVYLAGRIGSQSVAAWTVLALANVGVWAFWGWIVKGLL